MTNIFDKEVWAFDCEWVPSIDAGRAVYGLPEDCPDEEVLKTMFEAQGATPENPRPFLRTAYCRIASIAMVMRKQPLPGAVEPQLRLYALPNIFDKREYNEKGSNADLLSDESCCEKNILSRFSDGLRKLSPILVGYNSRASDMRILLQRSVINGLPAPELYRRVTCKPWESCDIDLMEMVCGMGRNYSVPLNDIARLCGIPGKLDMNGNDVCGAWYRGERVSIVQYNCFDALTTYLLWLRIALLDGNINAERYRIEQLAVKALLEREIKNGHVFLQTFLDAWKPQLQD